jgi:4-amino-4-deoxy-L-arabinose transferase-like glycosyltransferase
MPEEKKRQVFRTALVLVALVALGLRLGFVLARQPEPAAVLTPLADATDYHHLALSLLDNGSYSAPGGEATAFRPPVYPAFLALMYAIFGKGNLLAVAIVQALLGTLNCLLAAAVARTAGLGRAAALVAAVVFTFYAPFAVQAAEILTEVLARTQLLLAVWLLLLALRRGGWAWYAAAGAAMALAILNKSALGAAAPFIGAVIIFRSAPEWRRRLLRAGSYALAAALILGAWSFRNHSVSGRFIPVSTNFPITFAQGVTKWSFYTNTWYGSDVKLLESPEDFLRLTQLRSYNGIEEELRTGGEWSARARLFISEHPGFFAKLTLRKALHFWSPLISNSRFAQLAALLMMTPVLLGGGWFVVRGLLRREHLDLILVALAIALPVTIPYAVSQPDIRYRLGLVDPIWIVMLAGIFSFYSRPTTKAP